MKFGNVKTFLNCNCGAVTSTVSSQHEDFGWFLVHELPHESPPVRFSGDSLLAAVVHVWVSASVLALRWTDDLSVSAGKGSSLELMDVTFALFSQTLSFVS